MAELRQSAEAIRDNPDLWALHGFANDVLEMLDRLDRFLAAVDEATADAGGHDSYVRAGAIFFEHERGLRGDS